MEDLGILRIAGLALVNLFMVFGLQLRADNSSSGPKEVSDSLYSFLELVDGSREDFITDAPEIDYLFRWPSCFKGRRSELDEKFGETLSRAGYKNTAWELTITSYLREKPEAWSSGAFERFENTFGAYDGVRGILVFLREDGVVGFGKRGLVFDSRNKWTYQEAHISIELGQLGLEVELPLSNYGRPSYLMGKDANRSDSITAMLRVLDSYKNMFYAVPTGSLFSENIESKMGVEALLPKLDCWEGGPDDLSAIPDDYWSRPN